METALRYEINQNIAELANRIYPTNAPAGATYPYLVYTRVSTKKVKTLDGIGNGQHLTYLFNIMAPKYSDMVRLRKAVEDILIGMVQRTIGTEGILVQDIDINNIEEQYEHALQVNRGIIDFTIYF